MSKLTKLKITAYEGINFKESEKGKELAVQFNPVNLGVTWGDKSRESHTVQIAGGKFKSVKVTEFVPAKLALKLTFDDSFKNDKNKSIAKRIKEFKNTCIRTNSEVHAPNYLQLNWGEFLFKGQLTSLKIDYTLFTPDGIPLRAELDCEFQRIVSSTTKAREDNEKSPDMTRIITVSAGDSLPLICNQHYGSPKYYWQVARHNNLASATQITPGQQIVLPPLVDEIDAYHKKI